MSLSADLLSCRNVTWKERRLLLVLISNIKRRHRRYRDHRNRLQSLLLWRKIEWNKKGEKGKVDGSRRRRDSLFLKSTFFPPHPFPPNVAFKRREENIPWPFLLRRRPFLETMDSIIYSTNSRSTACGEGQSKQARGDKALLRTCRSLKAASSPPSNPLSQLGASTPPTSL